jgi:hypothetical protein
LFKDFMRLVASHLAGAIAARGDPDDQAHITATP